jgi:hypothetical protein
LILELLLFANNPVGAAETREFQILPSGCMVGNTVPNTPNVDVYLDGNYVGNSGPNYPYCTVFVTTTIGYHNVKLMRNGCEKVYNNVLFEDKGYRLVKLDYCDCTQ